MIEEKSLDDALTASIMLAAMAHKGQPDLGKAPYILHPLAVMARMKSLEGKIVAVLHDVLEDSAFTYDSLIQLGIPKNLADLVEVLTRKESEDYINDYIARVAASSETAILVKLADLAENMRTDRPADGHEGRMVRYTKAKEILLEALDKLNNHGGKKAS